ncbi:uncharacterized protein [Montipora capricornis]|uniref:uncharacterized protein n=1 Tax=Montipora capricornis TaxID=246305 RepID=UPI0035F2078E
MGYSLTNARNGKSMSRISKWPNLRPPSLKDDKLIKGVTGHRSDALQGYKRETEEQLLKVSKIVQGQKEKESTVKGNYISALNYCHWSTLPFSTTTSEELINLFSDHDQAAPELNTPDINNSSSSSSESPIEWFAAKINGYYKNNLKIGHLNVNSIFGKSDEVVNLLEKCAFDILFISESKIDGSVSSTLFAYAEYRIIRKDRKKGGGGLLVYIRSNVTAHRQIKLESDGIESICLDVKGCANNWFLICACYRSPGKCKITEFIPACATAAEKMYAKQKEILFIGDFNMNLLKSSDNPNGPNKDLTKFIEQFCLTNVIHEATRTTNYSKTLLDVVLTSHPERLAKSGTLQVGISDHDLIFVVRKQKIPKPKARTIEFRTLKNLDQKLRNNQLPWISPDIQMQIRKRNRLYKKFRRTPTDLNWSNYKVQRNTVTALKKKAVKDFCTNAASTKSCSGLFWKKMKPLLPNNNSSGDSLNDIFLLDNGKVASNPGATLNESFANPRIPEPVLNLSEEVFTDHPSIVTIKSKFNPPNFSFAEINSETMTAYLSKIEVKKSTGHDGISPKILKFSTPSLVGPLTTLFNYRIRTSTMPSSWKMSNVLPIYKKRGHSTATALIKLADDWRKSLDEKQEVGVVAIDLSKAFDCICHNLLLAKLKAYGLHDTALKLLRSFLQERKQRVMCNNSCSNWIPIRCGVPQGSLLSPLLFNIFMNDMNEAVINSSLRLYADDTTQYVADKNPIVLQSSLNQDMERLSSWLDHNYLRANGDKTQAMVLGKSTHHYDLKFNGAPIDIKEHLKIFGFTCSNSSVGKGEVGSRCSLGDVERVFAKHTEDKSTQTCFLFSSEVDSISMDHTYAFSFGDIIDIKESRQSIQEQLEVKEEILINLKKKVGQLQKEIDEYKQREFTLEKLKNDNSAIKFYTGFPNYTALLAFHNYLKPKVAKLQYWGPKNIKGWSFC